MAEPPVLIRRRVSFKRFGRRVYYFIEPVPYGLLLQAQSRADGAAWLFWGSVKPVGFWARLLLPFCAAGLRAAFQTMLYDSSSSGDGQERGRRELPRARVEAQALFLPRLCKAYGWTLEEAMAVPLADLLHFYKAAMHFRSLDDLYKANLAGVQNPPKSQPFDLQGRWEKVLAEETERAKSEPAPQLKADVLHAALSRFGGGTIQ